MTNQRREEIYGQIEEIAGFPPKHTAGWSSYLAGLGTDLETFEDEVDRVREHMEKNLL